MALFTGKGDSGTTKVFNSEPGKRISKASCQTEALGSLDEANSFLGLCKVHPDSVRYTLHATRLADIVHNVQQNLFIVQAELAGAPKTIEEKKVKDIETIINDIEKELPPIKTFFIAGGTELAALFDVARTQARRAERKVVTAVEGGEVKLGNHTRAYLNRLSSLLYALARFSNHRAGISETPPTYQ